MKQYICVITRIENSKMYIDSYDNDLEHRDFLYINPALFNGMCGRRYHTVYCDKHFLDDEIGKILVKEIFKPMASLKGGDGIIFV